MNEKKKLPTSKLLCIIAILIVVMAAVYTIIYLKTKPMQSSGKGFSGGKRGNAETVFSIKTQKLEKTTLHGYIITNGEIESQNSVSVFPDTSGKIISTRVILGSTVRRGDIIAYIDPSQPGERYQQSPVYAPISGSIISTPLKNGTTVNTNKEITQIGDINNLQIVSEIPERYVAVLKPGLKATVTVEAYPELGFNATVTRVSPVVDSNSRTKQIILTFDERDQRINAGMFGKVTLYTEDYSDEVTMPRDSLIEKDDLYYAFVVKDDSTVEKREVKLGKNVDGITQILSGVNEGEIVVTQGQTALSDGAKVHDIANGYEAQRPLGDATTNEPRMQDKRGNNTPTTKDKNL